jgi:hypothetical protein
MNDSRPDGQLRQVRNVRILHLHLTPIGPILDVPEVRLIAAMSLKYYVNHLSKTSRRRDRAGVIVTAALMLVLAACSGGTPAGETPNGEGGATETSAGEPTPVEAVPTVTPAPFPTPEPEPEYDYTRVSSLTGSPQDTPEGTFELYIRDAIAQQVTLQRERIDMRVRYQEPEIVERDVGGLVVDVTLIEDRSRMSELSDTRVVFDVDMDVLVTYASGETEQGICGWPVNLEQHEGLWYVINPSELALFVNCGF